MPLITFDFDESLTQPIWNPKYGYFEPSSNPNYDAIAKLKDFHLSGNEIRIVTTRWRPKEIEDFIRLHQLPVAGIHCTEGELKAKTLNQLGSILHFDDNEAEAIANQKLRIPTTLVSFIFDSARNIVVCEFTEWRAPQE